MSDDTSHPRAGRDHTSFYRKLFDSMDMAKPMRDVMADLDVTSSYRKLIDSMDMAKPMRDVMADLDVTSSYRKLIDSMDMAKPMRDVMADLDVTSSYRELIKSIDGTIDAQVEHEIIQPYVEAITEVDEPGTVLGLEQALAQFSEAPDAAQGLSDPTRVAIAVYLALLAFALCAAFYLHHPEAAQVMLDATTPATWAWAIGSAVYHRLGGADNTDED